MSNKPYSLGYNGHAKSCPCNLCAKKHAAHVQKMWELNGSYAYPRSADETVFVNSYFRRQPNHFRRKPKFADAMQKLIKTIRKGKE